MAATGLIYDMASTTRLQLEARSPSPNGTSSNKQNEQQGKRPSFRNMQDLVTFVVGPEKKEFVVHKSFVCHASSVLRAAFNSNFLEGETQRYVLEDTTEAAFYLFSEWVYTQNIHWDGEGKNEPTSNSLPQVWVLAEKLLVPKLQNRVMNLIEDIRKIRGTFPLTIPWIYDNTTYDSPLRRIYVHQYAWNLQSHTYRRADILLPTEFFIDLAVCLRDINLQKLEFSRDMKDFYVKDD